MQLYDILFGNEQEEKSIDPNLKQGQEFMKYNKMYAKEALPHLNLLQKTHVNSVVENLDNQNSTQGKATVTSKATQKVNKLQDQFNKTLADYSATYKIFSEDLMKKNQSQQQISSYFGKVISDSDGNYSYVNDFGYTHRYSTDAWNKNDSTCSSVPELVDVDDLQLFRKGPDMGSGQACNIAGQNVQNEETLEVAWVDIKGYKHVYSKEIWEKKESSCNLDPIKLTSSQYIAIPEGSPMTTTHVCDQLDVNPKTWEKLNTLNDKLVSIAEKLLDEIGTLDETDMALKNEIKQQQQTIQSYISSFKDDKKVIVKANNDVDNLNGKESDSESYLNYAYSRYILWIILAILMFLLTTQSLAGTSSNLSMAVTVVSLLVIMYMALKWLYHKF